MYLQNELQVRIGNNYSLHISTNIPFKDTNSLIDYEALANELTELKINKDSRFMKSETKVYKRSDLYNDEVQNDKDFVANIIQGTDCYSVEMNKKFENFDGTDILDKPWMSIKKTYFKDDKGYIIKEGDYIKLGKIIFKVVEIKIKESENMKIANLTKMIKDNCQMLQLNASQSPFVRNFPTLLNNDLTNINTINIMRADHSRDMVDQPIQNDNTFVIKKEKKKL